MDGNQTISSIFDVSSNIFKDSTLFGTYYNPLSITTPPRPSKVCMAAKLQQLTTLTPSLLEASSPQPFANPTTPISSTPSWEGIPPQRTPFSQVPFRFSPPAVVSTLVMVALYFPNLTLGIPMLYLYPPLPPAPSTLTPHLILTPIYPKGITHVSSTKSTQA